MQSNPEQLKKLLKSLENADKIEKSLLIFSHASYYEKIANLMRVNSISFAKTREIFFPRLMQLFNPDVNLRFKNATLRQSKHHWWWTLNQVFDSISSNKFDIRY